MNELAAFFTPLDPIAIYAAFMSTVIAIIEVWRWRLEKSRVYASLVVDAPHKAFAQWDPETLNLHLLDKRGEGPQPTLEFGITNIGSGIARKIHINVLFQCYDLREMIERSGVFSTITSTITDDLIILISEDVAQDRDDPALHTIDRAKRKIEYNIEGKETLRVIDPTKAAAQEWQVKVQLPRPVCRAILLYCAASYLEITRQRVGSVGERIESSASGSSRDPGMPPPPDTWSNYRHVLPSLVVELRYSDDFRRTYQNRFEIPGAFLCMPNLGIGRYPRPRGMHVQFGFGKARELEAQADRPEPARQMPHLATVVKSERLSRKWPMR